MKSIKFLRIKKGLTQLQLAKLLGVDQTTVAKWENNLSLPRADKLPLLTHTLGCSIEELFNNYDCFDSTTQMEVKIKNGD